MEAKLDFGAKLVLGVYSALALAPFVIGAALVVAAIVGLVRWIL